VGRGYGARDPDAIRRAGWMAFVICMSFMAVTASVMILLPQVLIGAFLDTADPANAQVIGFAVLFLAFAALFQAADGGQAVLIGMLRGLHDTRVPMLIAATGYWIIGLPLGAVLAFPLGWRGAGIWTGLATGLSVVAVLLMWRWLRRDRIGLVPTGGKSQTLLELAPAHP
jgi:MATE family multidrug resistance protein